MATDAEWTKRWKLLAQFLISGSILTISSYILLTHGYSEGNEKWATGMIGAVLGYWFK